MVRLKEKERKAEVDQQTEVDGRGEGRVELFVVVVPLVILKSNHARQAELQVGLQAESDVNIEVELLVDVADAFRDLIVPKEE